MTEKFIVIIFVFLVFTNSHYVHTQTLVYNVKWTQNIVENFDNQKITLLHFENASYDLGSSLPKFVENIKINSENVQAVLTNYTVETIPNEEIQNIDTKNIDEVFQFKSTITYSRKQPYINFELIPVRFNNNIGKFERIVSFEIRIEPNINKLSDKFIQNYSSSSVLSSGKWKKIKITQTGIYKLTYRQIMEMGFSNPSTIKVYGNGGAFYGFSNNVSRIDDLAEIPIFINKGNDGIFNEGDYILFYAKAPIYWRYDSNNQAFVHSLHPYTNESYYFLTDGGNSPTQINQINYDSLTSTHIINSFDDYQFHELELTNFLKSGRLWVGESFNTTLTYNYSFYFPNIVPNSNLYLQSGLFARSSVSSSFTFSVNGSVIGSQSISGSGSNASYTGETFKKRFSHNSPSVNISITYNKPASGGEGWLDYLLLNVRRQLIFNGGQMMFRDISSVGNGNVAEFQISTTKSNAIVWNITNPVQPFEVKASFENNVLKFKAPASNLEEYIIFDGSSFLSPTVVGDVANQNLHALSDIDFVIVSHRNFLSAANEIAEIHRKYDNLSVVVVTPEEIYNEFSSGMPDISAIKFFMKMLYDRAGNDSLKMPKYLLLFGDGSYNNRTYSSENTNFILSYQSANSLVAVNSLTSDDFFGLLDNNEYEYIGTLDIGIGRIPVKSLTEAQQYVNKLKNYYSANSLGEWRNWITLLADDEDVNEHMSQSNTLAQYLETNFQQYVLDKIYLDAFSQKTTPTGDRYPDANESVEQRMKKGCLVFNYTGHGNEYALAHEHVIIVSDIISWSNFNTLPLFITATCEFGRWDDYHRVSAGELVLLNPRGGAISMLTTTRLVYSTSNFALNKSFYECLFPKNTQGEYLRLGDAYRLAKNKTGGLGDINKRNFSLLGNPAMRIAFPKYSVITDSINGIHVSIFNDTIRPLQKVTLCGHIEHNQQVLNSFNGEIIITVFDKPSNVTTLANDGGTPFQFTIQKDILFKGKATVSNGYFTCQFIVPKDIKHTNGTGKISYYAQKLQSVEDATGSFTQIILGGNAYQIEDNKGPDIELFMNNESFSDGGITNESPTLIVKLYDENGINTVSNSIGHDITATLDNNPSLKYILNDNYISEKDNYRKGTATYSFSKLTPGEHSITVKAWDVVNNSSQKTIRFIVQNSDELSINRVINYPNPFTSKTSFYFEHNYPNTSLQTTIQIFTVTGRIIKTITTDTFSEGFRSEPIEWDGKDDYGDNIAPGVYFYTIRVSNGHKTTQKIEKLVKLK
ncbi:MAG: type IX secretion system sortase PorU [Bacteroidales bacterium]|nr:type IX secretion system sortase PorU [Bacteroidales bacterium]